MDSKFTAGKMASFRLRKTGDERVIEWLNCQSSVSDSLYFLIEQCVQQYGIQDLGNFIMAKRTILPTAKEIEEPLLKKLYKAGEEGMRPSELYEPLAREFNLTDEQRYSKAKTSSEPQWNNNVRWSKEALKNKGFVESPKYGIWALTELGREYVENTLK